ncbi:MAG: peptidoglycan binding protein CsiV [Gammaproteobacteria bacterium]|nr:peptidoglycan binding protein CsiV [Gammaproteobacteria bacterium]
MFRTLFRSLALSAGLLLALPAAAADKQPIYDVEALVFARPSADTRVEHWPDRSELSPHQDENARSLLPVRSAPGEPQAFQRLPEETLRLAREYQRLVDAPDLEPLLHLAWVQPGLGRDNAVPVVIEGGTEPGGHVEGTLRVILARYLHVEADLRYRRPEDVRDDAEIGDVLDAPHDLYRLKESRRMRSKEIHYLDHPLFGVVIVITPRV